MLESGIAPPKKDPIATPPAEVTDLLLAWGAGDESAFDALAPLVYDELKRLARRYMAGERVGHTLQATALVNEAYLKLVDINQVQWQNRAHFFAMSARLMRRILVDFARSKHYAKTRRGGQKVSLDEALLVVGSGPESGRGRRCPAGAGGCRREKEPGRGDAVFRRVERGGNG